MSAPGANALLSKNRVWENFSTAPLTAQENLFLTPDTSREIHSSAYDSASGVCIYLYTHGNPVNFTDPSGNLTLGGAISATIGAITKLAKLTAIGAAVGGTIGGVIGSQNELGFFRGVWVGAISGAAIQVGYATGRLKDVLWGGLLNAIAATVSYVAIEVTQSNPHWGGLVPTIASAFAFGALSSAVVGHFDLDSWKAQSGAAALTSFIATVISDIIDAITTDSQFNLGATLLRGTGNAVIAALTQPAAAASLLSGAKGSGAADITIELFETAAAKNRTFGVVQALVAGAYANGPNAIANSL